MATFFSRTFIKLGSASLFATGTAMWCLSDYKKTDLSDGSKKTPCSNSYEVNKVHASFFSSNKFSSPTKWNDNWDGRAPVGDDDVKPKAARHIYLVRHGQYNLKGKGDENRYLTELGRKQSAYTGQRLKEMNHNYSIMVNSTMTRARETADIIFEQINKNIPRKTEDLLREGAPYPPEPPVGDWKPEAHQYQKDNARLEEAYKKYFHRADPEQQHSSHEVVVFHANVIRYFLMRLLQLPPEAWLRLSLHHCSVTWVTIYPNGRVSVKSIGDAGHIPADKLSFS